MKKTVLLTILALFVFGRFVHAKNLSYISPDKKWIAVANCKRDSKKTVTTGQEAAYKLRCTLEIASKTTGKKQLLIRMDFPDARYANSIITGFPSWSRSSRYFVFYGYIGLGWREGISVFDTVSGKSTLIFERSENVTILNPDGPDRNLYAKIYMKSNSFVFHTVDDSSVREDGAGGQEYDGQRLEYSIAGSLISSYPIKVHSEYPGEASAD